MKYKAIVADVDGTLIAPSEKEATVPSKIVREKVAKAQKKGVIFTIATGRSLSWTTNIISGLNLSSPIILDNGAKIYDCKTKKYIWFSLLPFKKIRQILTLLAPLKLDNVYLLDDDRRLRGDIKINRGKISKILILGLPPKKNEKIYQMLKGISKINITKTISGIGPVSESIHITNYNANKKLALEKIAKILKIKTEEMIGIGDSYNDYSFLKICGLKVAMENSTPDIKAIADYIAPSYKNDGVAKVIDKYILNNC